MSAEDKFEVDLGFNVKEASGEAFCEGHLKYNSLPYQGLVTSILLVYYSRKNN